MYAGQRICPTAQMLSPISKIQCLLPHSRWPGLGRREQEGSMTWCAIMASLDGVGEENGGVSEGSSAIVCVLTETRFSRT